jgi:hypothetical protein
MTPRKSGVKGYAVTCRRVDYNLELTVPSLLRGRISGSSGYFEASLVVIAWPRLAMSECFRAKGPGHPECVAQADSRPPKTNGRLGLASRLVAVPIWLAVIVPGLTGFTLVGDMFSVSLGGPVC